MTAITAPPLARCIAPTNAALGESPIWIAGEGAVYWVDIEGARIFRHVPTSAHTEVCDLPFAVSALAATADGRLLCTARASTFLLDPRTGELTKASDLPGARDGVRINDGCCHPDGAFWFGTMDIGERAPSGHFFRLAGSGACEQIEASFIITNGPAFNANGSLGYFVDSVGRRILRVDLRHGRIAGTPSVFARIAPDQGYPDGLAVDADDGVWCCHWGGARITRFDADGRVSTVLHLPVANVTKCAFGGEALNRLFVTTARKGLDDAALARQPQAGGLFEIEIGYRGLVPVPFRSSLREQAFAHLQFFAVTDIQLTNTAADCEQRAASPGGKQWNRNSKPSKSTLRAHSAACGSPVPASLTITPGTITRNSN